MGYYSDVIIVINKNKQNNYNNLIDDINIINNIDNNSIIIKEKEDSICYIITRCKWYNFYIEDKLASLFNDNDYLFIRIGENYDDIFIEGNYWNNSFNVKIKTNLYINNRPLYKLL